MNRQTKAMLIGVDGLPPWLLERLCERFFTLGMLAEEGCWGRLRSTIPYTTAPAWTSMVTGVKPGVHGIYDFLYLDREYKLRVAKSSDCRSKPIWRRLEEEGLRSIIINVPPFYPAEDINSVMIGSFPYHTLSVYPPSLEGRVKQMGYIIDVDNVVERMKRDRIGTLRALLRAEKKRMKVAQYLMDRVPWDLFMIVLTFADRMLHNLPIFTIENALEVWGERSSFIDRLKVERRLQRLIGEMFKLLDEFLSRCLKRLGEGLLILASDHGMTPRPRAFLINTWLRDQGYINHQKTRALCYSTVMPFGLIRLNLKGRERGGVVPRWRYEETLEDIEEGLRSLKDEETGKNIIKETWRGEELYGSRAEGHPPDLIFEVEREYTVDPWRLKDDIIVESLRSNDHERFGIFLIYGGEEHQREMDIREIHDLILEALT